LTAAVERPITATGDDKLGAAFFTDISLSNLIRHLGLHLLPHILNSQQEIFLAQSSKLKAQSLKE
jgi:hypothetical protein